MNMSLKWGTIEQIKSRACLVLLLTSDRNWSQLHKSSVALFPHL